ncbi:MAG: sulfite exporter TauE/SafE family protein [Spirochaetes bacterium]|nr:sulfite exporter TauE/SafE family protein [Spirochaetota bacterium]
MFYIEGFLVGLSTGTSCIMSCYPVLLPFLLSQIKGLKDSSIKWILFIFGRLISYLSVGGIVGISGYYLLGYVDPKVQILLKRLSWVLIGLLFITNSIKFLFLKEDLIKFEDDNKKDRLKNNRCFLKFPIIFLRKNINLNNERLYSFILGFLAGLNICSPFIFAITRVFTFSSNSVTQSIFSGILYFFSFFLGTTIFLLPLLLTGLLNNLWKEKKEEVKNNLQFISRVAMFIIGVYFFLFEGLFYLISVRFK